MSKGAPTAPKPPGGGGKANPASQPKLGSPTSSGWGGGGMKPLAGGMAGAPAPAAGGGKASKPVALGSPTSSGWGGAGVKPLAPGMPSPASPPPGLADKLGLNGGAGSPAPAGTPATLPYRGPAAPVNDDVFGRVQPLYDKSVSRYNDLMDQRRRLIDPVPGFDGSAVRDPFGQPRTPVGPNVPQPFEPSAKAVMPPAGGAGKSPQDSQANLDFLKQLQQAGPGVQPPVQYAGPIY
jgi:hypothetical protein